MTYSIYFDPDDNSYVIHGVSSKRRRGIYVSTIANPGHTYWASVLPTRMNYFTYPDTNPEEDFHESIQVIATFRSLKSYFAWIDAHPEYLI